MQNNFVLEGSWNINNNINHINISIILIFQLPSKTKLFCIHIVMLYLDIFEFFKKLCIFNRKKKRVVSWIRTSSVLAGLFEKYFTTWKRSKNYLMEISSIKLFIQKNSLILPTRSWIVMRPFLWLAAHGYI